MTTVEMGDPERARRLTAVIFEYLGNTGSRLLDDCEEFVKELTDQLDEAYPQYVPCPECGAIGSDACTPKWAFGETDGVWHETRIDRDILGESITGDLGVACPVCWASEKEGCVRGKAGTPIWDQGKPLGRNHDARVLAAQVKGVI